MHCSHLSQLEHRKMRKVMRKKVATAARLPHRVICICPPLSKLPSGPIVGGKWHRLLDLVSPSKVATWGQRAASSCRENNVCIENFSREMPESGSKFLVGRGVEGAFEQSREVCAECTGLDLELPLGKFPSVVQAFVFSPKTQSRSVQWLAQCLRQQMSCYLDMFGDRFLMSSNKFKTPNTPQQMNKCLFGFPCFFVFVFFLLEQCKALITAFT